jgi:hypothetical protein
VHRLFAITFVYIVIGLSGLGLGYARPIIEIPKRVFVKSHEMRLGDLARLKGFSKTKTTTCPISDWSFSYGRNSTAVP